LALHTDPPPPLPAKRPKGDAETALEYKNKDALVPAESQGESEEMIGRALGAARRIARKAEEQNDQWFWTSFGKIGRLLSSRC
jgi:hypothetical protein